MKTMVWLMGFIFFIQGCGVGSQQQKQEVQLTHGVDDSAGGVSTYIISTSQATYYLEKLGGGLSSMIDKDGVDWLGFHNEKGSAHKGEYRGFPNAIHKQDGSYFHALNAGTALSTSVVAKESDDHIRIVFTSGNGAWQGQWDFYPERCDFTMTQISAGFKYWVLYEGVPGGEMNDDDFWYSSADSQTHLIDEPFIGDFPSPEWIAFGDVKSPRMLYMLHHEDDSHPDDYLRRPDMTVFGFGRGNINETRTATTKYLDTQQTFSIGFVESSEYAEIENSIKTILR
ncbi:hypothetical protein KO534_14910 [Paraglaciecola arctica]|nr:hypothetical protein [Paraglaciecola arctica]